MQVILTPLDPWTSVVIDTNPQATVSSLISSYCTLRGISYNNRLSVFHENKKLPPFSTLAALNIVSGQKLHIGIEENTLNVEWEWPLILAVAAVILGLIGILSLSLIHGLTGGKYPDDFGVVMDAGSSKTNTIVYKWRSDKFKGTGCVSQEDNCYAPGGIANMDPMKLDDVLDCAQSVTHIIDKPALPRTPLYFAATAGMRLLNETNPSRASEILKQLHLHLNETGLSVRDIEIISGRDEGLYGWITVNFLKKTFETPQQRKPWVPTTFGALDMGGASLQISHSLPEPGSIDSVVNMTLYGQTHYVFSHSNLCFGRTESEKRYRYLLLKNVDDDNIEDPCLPSGFKLNVSSDDFFKNPCTNSTRFDRNSTENLEKIYTFVGTSNPGHCMGNVSLLLDREACESYFKDCFLILDAIPKDQEFVAFAGFVYTTNYLHIADSSMAEYREAVQNFCAKNSSELGIPSNDSFITQYCYNGNYIYQVLTRGFYFNEETWKNIKFIEKISGKDVGWTLGYMINATNIIPEKAPSATLISGLALALCIVLFIIIISGAMCFVVKHHRRDTYDTKS